MKIINTLKDSINLHKDKAFFSLSNIVKVLIYFLTTKIVSLLIGPVGVTLVSQLQNIISILQVIATGGMTVGVTKYTADYKDQVIRQYKLNNTALLMTIMFSLLVAIILFVSFNDISIYFLGSEKYGYVLVLTGFFIIGYSLQNLNNSILVGAKKYNLSAKYTIISSLFGLIYSITLIYFLKIHGALIATATFQSFGFICRLLLVDLKDFLKYKITFKIDWILVKKLLKYSLFTFINATSIPLAQIFIRQIIIDRVGITDAGIWDAMNRISFGISFFVNITFSAYFIPAVSNIKNQSVLKLWLRKNIFFLTIIMSSLCFFVFLFKELVIRILYTSEFNSMIVLLDYQLLGEFFKMMGWLFGSIMLAKALTFDAILFEVIFNVISICILSYLFISKDNFHNVSMLYFLNYVMYFIFSLIHFKFKTVKQFSSSASAS
ncbi:O-antigen translocase [Siphonobacter sp.]|uniref:O-antigen translocase n=1 Tax=Siphonobacter sp. TaxID=1869184 RepID=UPI003B3B2562